ncbi:L-aspartate oxidase [Pirellulimonas nuda]|uniref:L-aspartate oxidase n=1 Tax=Pirellulimonas nuda TaxID=2528009 RepID=A0A518D5H3_9BACT|nr:L-aspartate oxidase [Pirellulimonas nuda]QDU86722.1 L-aspartate oxidase [Pirellulimonas nuda]
MPPATPRYLVPFHPKRIPHHFVDVLIVGGGIAGLRAAMEVDPPLSLLVITKDAMRESNSAYAQGGIAGVLDPDDNFENHVADTLVAGANLCDQQVVEMVVREAPEAIRLLMQWGAVFDAHAGGELMLGREGGHSHRRIVHALGDATGHEIMRAMIRRVEQQRLGQLWPDTFTIDLLTDQGPDQAMECRGALVWNAHHGKTFVWAKQTILCTGGSGQVYRESTNPPIATGDGHAMAFRAGAVLADMEFMQFHPTVLYIAGSSRSLITEAVRGEGAHLIDSEGARFMTGYDERAELAPRDVVSRSIVEQMEKTRHPCVYLSLAHLGADEVRARFPGIAKACMQFGIDIATDPIPVRPGAHYMLGGVAVDQQARTSLPRLWAAGEATSSGLHGANRLASNSLLEGLVYGQRAGAGASRLALEEGDTFHAIPLENPPVEAPAGAASAALDLEDIRNALKSLMWRNAGVWRNGPSLDEALRSIHRWTRYVLPRQLTEPDGWELQNMLIVSELMIAAAQQRTESRGVHLRTDFPVADDAAWRRHVRLRRSDQGEVIVEETPQSEPSA